MKSCKTPGVSWDKTRKKWEAFIMINGRKVTLGRYTDIESAIAIRHDAEVNIENFDEWLKTIRKPDVSIKIGNMYCGLKVIKRLSDHVSPSGKPNTRYLCECVICKTQHITLGGNLRSESTSCPKCRITYLRDLTGEVFGRLKVAGYNKDTRKWICDCKCGNTVELTTTQLTNKDNQSCGCWHTETQAKNCAKGDALKVFDTNIGILKSNKIRRHNTTGVTGVMIRHGKYNAYIYFQKKRYDLGYYNNLKDAVKARALGKERLHNDFLEWYDDYINSGGKNGEIQADNSKPKMGSE